MKSVNSFLVTVVLGMFFAGAAAADTLELRDGRVLKGKYLGGTQAVLRFEINGEVQTFNTTDAVALTFTVMPAFCSCSGSRSGDVPATAWRAPLQAGRDHPRGTISAGTYDRRCGFRKEPRG